MIYTSNFSKIRDLIYHHGFKYSDLVGVSSSKPDIGFKINWCEELAPKLGNLIVYKANLMSWKEYAEKYYNQLYDMEWVFWRDFEANFDGKVLLCYEKDYKHCHRYLIGKFFEWWSCKSGVFKEI